MRSSPFARLSVALLPLLASCGGGGGGPTTGTLMVTLKDKPVHAADHVYVTIDRVDVYRIVDDKEVKETLVETPQQHDLLALQHGVEAILGTSSFPPGEYKAIRLIVAKDTKDEIRTLPADQLKNYIVVDGVPHPLIVPSGSKTGIKINQRFTVGAGETTVMTFDFDVRKSVSRRGKKKGVYTLRPRLCVEVVVSPAEEDTSPNGSISGTVQAEGALAIPAGTVVSAQQLGAEVASGTVESTSRPATT
jgi:hypothetical protein